MMEYRSIAEMESNAVVPPPDAKVTKKPVIQAIAGYFGLFRDNFDGGAEFEVRSAECGIGV